MKYLVIIVVLCFTGNAWSQQSYQIGRFDRVVVSPHINLVLVKGNTEEVKIEALGVDEGEIHVEEHNDLLSIYLEGARYFERNDDFYDNDERWRHDGYKDVEVTAYVTYTYLESIQIRGAQQLTCLDAIDQDRLKVSIYGEVEATFGELVLEEFRLSVFGDNNIMVQSGNIDDQIIRSYGSNDLSLEKVFSDEIRVSSFGSNSFNLQAEDEIRVTSFGDADIEFTGNAFVSRGIIIGDTNIDRYNIY